MKYKVFGKIILDTENNESVGNFLAFISVVGITLFIYIWTILLALYILDA